MNSTRAISFHPGEGRIILPSGGSALHHAVENNWYEGSRWSPNRSWIWFPMQEAKRDLDRFTRLELAKRARYLYKNSPLIRGVIERIVTLVVGSGFYPVFKTSNEEWNERAKLWWERKGRNIHLGCRCSFMNYQRAVVRAKLIDGECFSVKTFDNTVTFRSYVQGLEADYISGGRVEQPYAENSAQDNGVYQVDGFNLNSQGIVVSYNVKNVKAPYAAENIIHHHSPKRLGEYRSETALASAINTSQDVDDILALEKDAVKEASSHKDIIKTENGTLDAEAFRSLRFGSNYPTVFNLPADDNTKTDYYRVQFVGAPVVLKKGDDYVPTRHERPGPAWQGFMDFLQNTICMSTTFPVSVILPINIGGTDIRRDLDIAQRAAEPMQIDLALESDEILEYLIQDEIYDGELRQGLPPDWNMRSWQFPQKINVDRGLAQQDREDVGHGLMSREEYHGRYGVDFREIEIAVIREAKARKKAIQDAGFKDTKEFVEVLSLDSKMFMTRSQDDEQLANSKTPPMKEPQNATA